MVVGLWLRFLLLGLEDWLLIDIIFVMLGSIIQTIRGGNNWQKLLVIRHHSTIAILLFLMLQWLLIGFLALETAIFFDILVVDIIAIFDDLSGLINDSLLMILVLVLTTTSFNYVVFFDGISSIVAVSFGIILL